MTSIGLAASILNMSHLDEVHLARNESERDKQILRRYIMLN